MRLRSSCNYVDMIHKYFKQLNLFMLSLFKGETDKDSSK